MMSNQSCIALLVIRARQIEKLADFYSALGLSFIRHRHGTGPEHFSSTLGNTVFEIYPASNPNESTAATRLGFSVPCLKTALERLQAMDAVVLTEPSHTEFGWRAVVRDFEGHKVELYEHAR